MLTVCAPQRVSLAFRLGTGRLPERDEQSVLVDRWKWLKQQFSAAPQQADQLLSVQPASRGAEIDKPELAAYTMLCSLILNLDETLSRE